MNTELQNQIEAILFYKGEPVKTKALSKMLGVGTKEIEEAANLLKESLEERGIRLLVKEDVLSLGTSPEMSDLIVSIRKEELSRDIGKAGLETLSIILYKGPIPRSEVDYIRGVNSSFIIRNLLIRGLVERNHNPNDSRSFLYKPTLELLSFLGVTTISELPEYEKVQADLQTFLDEKDAEEKGDEEAFAENLTQ